MSRDDDEARLEAQRLWGTPSPDAPGQGGVCPHGDPACPCPDGLMCHYEGPDAWPAPGQGEADAGGGVEALDALVRLLARHVLGHLTPEHCTADCMARALIASPWLTAHDASVVAAARADAEARLAAVSRECDFAEEHHRHVANDEILVEVGLIRSPTQAANYGIPTTRLAAPASSSPEPTSGEGERP